MEKLCDPRSAVLGCHSKNRPILLPNVTIKWPWMRPCRREGEILRSLTSAPGVHRLLLQLLIPRTGRILCGRIPSFFLTFRAVGSIGRISYILSKGGLVCEDIYANRCNLEPSEMVNRGSKMTSKCLKF